MATKPPPTEPVAEGTLIAVCEVGPRDGFQNEKTFIPTDRKIAIANALFASGLRRMQVTSFVSPRAVPQLADAEEVLAGIDRPEGAYVTALVPNLRGRSAPFDVRLTGCTRWCRPPRRTT
jgi:hydroxymethylglutaryl-CoA lyase